MKNKKQLENFLSAVKIWKILLKADIRLYSDGFCRFNGIFGRSVTFGHLSITKEKMKSIRNPNGSLREPFLDKLARFMCKQRPRMPSFSNGELVILSLTRLITSEGPSEATA